jgi:hypothetical protein
MRSIVLAALALGACSSSSPATPDASDAGTTSDATTTSDAGDAPAGPTLYGAVTVDLVKDSHTAFLGVFKDGESLPPSPIVDPGQTMGDCTLFVPREVKCATACADGSQCVGVDRCQRAPLAVSAGILHVTGLGAGALDLEPTGKSPSYQAVPTLPYPACAEGGAVDLTGDGFALHGRCVSQLEVTSAPPILVRAGQPVHLAWKAPGVSAISRVEIELEISHHGGFAGQIDCSVADTGSFDIPAPLVTALVARGLAGFPTVKVARVARASAAGQPHVTLAVSSQVELDVDTGVISCGTDEAPPCPTGKSCQTNFTCQ